MPVFVAALLGGLVQLAASMAGRIMIALGVGIVSYVGIHAVMSQLTTNIFSGFGGTSSMLQGVLGTLRIGACANVLISAYTVRLTLGGLGSDTMKRFILK